MPRRALIRPPPDCPRPGGAGDTQARVDYSQSAVVGRRRWLAGLATSVCAPVLVGCSEPEPALRVGTTVAPGTELLFLARELQLLSAQRVRLVELLARTDNMRLMEEGRLDALACSLDEMMTLRYKGVDLRIVAVLDISQGADALMARAGLSSLAQLRGARVGAEDSVTGSALYDKLMEAADLKAEDAIRVPITTDQSVAMYLSERVDAVLTSEPWVSQLEALGAVRLYDSSRAPQRFVNVLAVRAEVTGRLDSLRHLVAAHFQGLTRYRSEPAQAGLVMAPRLLMAPQDVPQAFRGLLLPDLVLNHEMLRQGGRFGQLVQALQKSLVDRRLLRQAVAFEQLADARFLPVL